jgi:NAD-dependent SIR2 family protein deacetylase
LTTSWPILREIFYDHFGAAKPNRAHEVLAAWETRGLLKVLITQNIDNLHHVAGSPCTLAHYVQRRWQKDNLAVLN